MIVNGQKADDMLSVSTYQVQNKASRDENREIVLSTPAAKKKFAGLQRAPESTDRAPTVTNVSGPVSRVGYVAFCQEMLLLKIGTSEKIRFFQKHTYKYAYDNADAPLSTRILHEGSAQARNEHYLYTRTGASVRTTIAYHPAPSWPWGFDRHF